MSPKAISARLAAVAAMTDLRPSERLRGKIDYSPAAISRRLEEVEAARRLCLALRGSTSS